MKNHRDLLGLLINALIVVLILAAIVFGLNKIGVYDLPDGIEKFFSGFGDEDNSDIGNEALIYDTLDFDENEDNVPSVADVSYENARSLLENVSVDVNYSQEILVENISEANVRTDRFIVSKRDSNFDVSVYNDKDVLVKTISTKDGFVYITNPLSPSGDGVVKLTASDFSISDECGFILTHSEFLESDFALDESTFSVEKGKYGSNLLITFENSFEDYTKTQIYTVCLDYGIVTDAKVFENGVLVYKMSTVSLHQVN